LPDLALTTNYRFDLYFGQLTTATFPHATRVRVGIGRYRG
jgi:hypothetical protein